MKTFRIAALAIVSLFAVYKLSYASDRAFIATTDNLLGISLSHELVDIEIVGSTSLVPHEHILEPYRVVRLRLERAYITSFFTKTVPGYSLLDIGIDRISGRPVSLINAVSMSGRFHKKIEGLPVLDLDERSRRHVMLTVRSDRSETWHANYTKDAEKCVGKSADSDLFEMIQSSSLGARACSHSVYPDGRKWLARNDGVAFAVIECQGDGKRIAGCSTEFAFQNYSVEIRFHQSLLADWRSVIAFGEAFLRSKQVER